MGLHSIRDSLLWRRVLPWLNLPQRQFSPTNQPFSHLSIINCHFFKMSMTMMSLPHSYYPPSYSDNTTIMLAIVFRRPFPIPGACARERPAENRWIIANIWQFITCTSYVMISFHLSSLIGHFEHGLTIRNGRIHRISERSTRTLLLPLMRCYLRWNGRSYDQKLYLRPLTFRPVALQTKLWNNSQPIKQFMMNVTISWLPHCTVVMDLSGLNAILYYVICFEWCWMIFIDLMAL